MTVAVATELRELRAQLERERDRRIVAEEWSAFLLVTLRSYLAAHDAYDRRPVAPRSVGSGCADIGSSSSADEESTKVVAGKTSAENERGVDGSSSSGRASAIPKLRRRFERGSASSGQEAAAKDSVQSETTSLRGTLYTVMCDAGQVQGKRCKRSCRVTDCGQQSSLKMFIIIIIIFIHQNHYNL
jgi:hypothetical protein